MTQQEQEGKTRIGLTCGDLNGVGLEIIMKIFMDNRMHQVCTPVIYVGSKTISLQRKLLNLNDFNYNTVRPGQEIILRKNNVMTCWEEELTIDWGKATDISGRYALRSLDAA